MSEPDRMRRRPSSLEVGRAERALVQLAAMLARLVNAIGFLAAGLAGVLTLRTWHIERNLLPA